MWVQRVPFSVLSATLVALGPARALASHAGAQASVGETLEPASSDPPAAEVDEPASPTRATAPGGGSGSDWEPDTNKFPLEQALDAWKVGEWGHVRKILEPLVSEGGQLDSRERTEMALRYLADATLFDPTLDETTSDRIATRYIVRLLDEYPSWEPPAEVHGPRLYDVHRRIKSARDDARTVSCEAENLVCQADLDELRRDYTKLQQNRDELQRAYDSEEVMVTDRVARNRGVAFIPFGVGHFYNSRPALGGVFLGVEAVLGGTGLGLLLNRQLVLGCRRDKEIGWFQPESMTCTPPAHVSNTQVGRRRDLEQGMGIGFFAVLAVDVLVSQLTFQKYTTLNTRRVPRSELEEELRKPTPQRKKARHRDKNASAKIRLLPAPAIVPGGAGFGVRLDF